MAGTDNHPEQQEAVNKDLGQILSELEKNSDGQSLPPVEKWNPEFCGDMELIIKRDGSWQYEGSPIGRQRLVKLFSTVLKKEDDKYFLVTPVEKLGIRVEDAPFLVIRMQVKDTAEGPIISFEDNCDNQIVLTKDNPIWVEHDSKTGEPSPYIMVRRNLHALIHRNVFYELVERAEERVIVDQKHLGVMSAGEFFSLGTI
ncbi:DUF1285 domain-containing protein [Kangiella aquimarina]|uniref:DUF1285 domain-containing protein n=1 Tax=Kangiella aquimarina TaxID=261965 RepID=A0ABZ0X5R1_9GAMM|nr:DUF1285 domain-containing protein [Kangiella aquimarina]WQG85736.1 DUF1285 domain-containing protein [Kangiella aquimarina]